MAKEKRFSPTDFVMAMPWQVHVYHGLNQGKCNGTRFSGSTWLRLFEVMGTEPRQITEIHVTFNLNLIASRKLKKPFRKTAMTCPVHLV
jgi:hypothetical protein